MTSTVAAAPAVLALDQVAPGVYVQRGEVAPASAANRGRVANRGVLVGPTGIVLVNTGASRGDGEALVAAVRRLATQPIVAAIDTQATPDQVLGNSAIAALGVPIIAHRATDAFMARNCPACIRAADADIGTRPAASTRIARPSWLIDGSTDLTLGGRSLSLLHFGWTAQPGAIAVLDRATGILFTGNLADFDVLPDVRAARVAAWRDALQALRRLDPARVVPGHGPVAGAERLAEVARYLGELQDATAAAYRRGVDLQQATRTVGADAFRGWVGYDRLQPSNVHFTYLALEHAELDAVEPPR